MEMKCTKNHLCKNLIEKCKIPGDSGYGLFLVRVLNTKMNKAETIGVKYLKNKQDKGLMFNNCPFCGSRIDFFRK